MATWPTSVPTDANLYIAVNELQTNLSSGVNSAVTTLTLNSTTNFPTVGLVLIDNEIIKYTGVSGSDLTGCTRGFDGTSAASHSAAAIVSFAICAAHHNVSKDEIIALCTYLSNNLGTGAQPLANGNRVLASNGSGKIIESSVTATELGYLSGVSSAIQTQLNLKAPLASPTFTGTVTTPVTADRALQTGTAGVLEAATTTKTELGYLNGVTSAIQTQLNGKVGTTGNETVAGNKTFSGTTDVTGQLKGKGTATNDSAAAGYIGEYIETVGSNTNAGASGAYADLCSITLTAGDWDVSASGTQSIGTGVGATAVRFGIGTVAGNDATGITSANSAQATSPSISGTGIVMHIASWRVSISGSQTFYFKMRIDYSSGTPTGQGIIHARRVR